MNERAKRDPELPQHCKGVMALRVERAGRVKYGMGPAVTHAVECPCCGYNTGRLETPLAAGIAWKLVSPHKAPLSVVKNTERAVLKLRDGTA